MKLARSIPAGLIDAAFASLATFLVAAYAAARLELEVLGVFALFFAAFLMAVQIPTQLLMLPAEVQSLAMAPRSRMWLPQLSLLRLTAPLLLSAGLVGAAILVAPAEAPSEAVTALAATAFAAAVLSPLQDHVRRVFHLAQASWRAASVSVVQFLGVALALPLLENLDTDASWVPLGGLFVANALSLAVGLTLATRNRGDRPDVDLSVSVLAESGRWLLVGGALPAVAGFAAASLVGGIAGSETLGVAEAARVAAQPVLVGAMGLAAVLGPRSMVAGANRQRAAARQISRLFTVLIVSGTAAYALVAGFDAAWNPLARVIPTAFEIKGLVTLTIVANLANALSNPLRLELIGGRREVAIARVETIASVARSATAALAGLLGAFAIPWAWATMAAAHGAGFWRALESHYAAPDAEPR